MLKREHDYAYVSKYLLIIERCFDAMFTLNCVTKTLMRVI